MGAAAEHGILDALSHAQVHVLADNGYQGAGPMVQVPQRRRRLDPETGRYRRLSQVSGILSPQSVATRCCAGSLRASAIAAVVGPPDIAQRGGHAGESVAAACSAKRRSGSDSVSGNRNPNGR
jgi:hypothetical protein